MLYLRHRRLHNYKFPFPSPPDSGPTQVQTRRTRHLRHTGHSVALRDRPLLRGLAVGTRSGRPVENNPLQIIRSLLFETHRTSAVRTFALRCTWPRKTGWQPMKEKRRQLQNHRCWHWLHGSKGLHHLLAAVVAASRRRAKYGNKDWENTKSTVWVLYIRQPQPELKLPAAAAAASDERQCGKLRPDHDLRASNTVDLDLQEQGCQQLFLSPKVAAAAAGHHGNASRAA